MRNTTVQSRTQESVVTRAKTESDTAGTKNVKDGITYAQAAAVSSIGTIVDVLGHLVIVDVTKTFPTSVPIYGLIAVNQIRTSDTSIYLYSDTGQTLRLYVYYMYYSYINGWDTIKNLWQSIGNNRYLSFFKDRYSDAYVDRYVNFKEITGNNYNPGYVFALVDSRDMS